MIPKTKVRTDEELQEHKVDHLKTPLNTEKEVPLKEEILPRRNYQGDTKKRRDVAASRKV